MCSHCVANFHARPEKMSVEEWLGQFQPLHEKQFPEFPREKKSAGSINGV